jgi:hypothetical protein
MTMRIKDYVLIGNADGGVRWSQRGGELALPAALRLGPLLGTLLGDDGTAAGSSAPLAACAG